MFEEPENPELVKAVKVDTDLKDMLVNYVGAQAEPGDGLVTV